MARFDGVSFTTFGVRIGSLKDDEIAALVEDNEGALWIGTLAGGLTRYKDGQFTTLTTADGLPDNSIRRLDLDSSSNLWMATRGGLTRYRDGQFFNVHESDGLPDNYIFAIRDDGQGNSWLTSARGIARIRQTDLEAFADGKTKKLESISLGYRNGLRTTSLIAGTQPEVCVGEAGQLPFCSLKGLVIINPQNQTSNPQVPPVFVEDVAINQKAEPVTRPANVPAGVGEVKIRYTTLSFVAPEKVRFKHRLEGLENTWVDAGTRRFAYYASLPPGSYRFRVIACNNDGIWNKAGTIYAFHPAPHIYQTRWFPMLILTRLAALVTAGYRLRVLRHQARERELQRRVDDAVAQVKVLRGLLPVCSRCKKIRDDEGYWNQIEKYLMRYSDIAFTHGLCPDCMKRL